MPHSTTSSGPIAAMQEPHSGQRLWLIAEIIALLKYMIKVL
jgi:hypothetical protein